MDNFDSPVKHYDQVEEAVVVLRRTLAAAEVTGDTEMENRATHDTLIGSLCGDRLCWLPAEHCQPLTI